MTDTKVLVAARLSRLVKGRDQLSIERQDDRARKYADEVGDPDPIVVADAGVSGAVSPFKRPALKAYLTDAPPEDWTELVASAIDRLGRNARDLYDLRNWCVDHGKRITILSPRLHWPPADDDFTSSIVWVVLEQLAQIELQQTKKRYADTRALLRERKSMLGKPIWGFRITGTKMSKTLTPDPAKVSYLVKMVELALAGKSQNDIAAWLDAEGVKPTAWLNWISKPEDQRGKRPSDKWSPKSVGQILRSESLYGVHRDSGKVLLKHQGVISKERWDQLQAKLDANPKRRGPTRNEPAMLTDSIYCARCQGVMHARRNYGRPRKDGTRPMWVGYRCDGLPRQPSTCKNMVRADDIEPWVDLWFTIPAAAGGSGFSDVEIMETIQIAAKGHADEVAEIDTEIDALDKNDPGWLAEVTRLYAQRADLVAKGTEPAHTEDHPTGILLGDYWPTLDDAGKRDYLRRAGVKVYASREDRWITGDPHKVLGALAHPAKVPPVEAREN